jgi:cytochrome c-type biogenesis protein CcmH/NrfG
VDPQSLWLIALTIATPIAGVVGFAVQLRQVKKARLENEKLQLEIAALRAKAAVAESRIVQVTTEEVLRFSSSDVMFSLATDDEVPGTKPKGQAFRQFLVNAAVVTGILLFVSYFLYDLYRLGAWLHEKL